MSNQEVLQQHTLLEHNAYKTIQTYSMVKQGDFVTVGCSGGADSIALLHLFYQWKEYLGITLQAVHLNHQLRGEESDRDEKFVKDFCQRYDIPFISKQLSVGELSKKEKKSIEEVARQERYKFFHETAKNGKIATAHTLSDSAETTIFRLARGTGIQGLTGIPPVRENIIRPLIGVTREEVEEYCRFYQLEYVIDSTNLETEYHRNKIRHLIMPVLKEMNSNVEHNMERVHKLLEEDRAYLQAESIKKQKKLTTRHGMLRQQFLEIPKVISSRILYNLLENYHITPSEKQIDEMQFAIQKGTILQLSKEYYLLCSQEYFCISNRIEEKISPIVLHMTEEKQQFFPISQEKTLQFTLLEYEEIKNISKSSPNRLKNIIDYDRMKLGVKVRTRESGDYFTLPDRDVTKTLKKLFNEEHIPLWERNSLLLLEAQGEILWIESFGASKISQSNSTTQMGIEIAVQYNITGEYYGKQN